MDNMAPEETGAPLDPEQEAAMEAAMAAAMTEGEETQIPQFDELGSETIHADPAALSMVYDLALPVAIELGRTRMSVQEILALGRGSVIQLERLAGEPIDVFVGDRRFAEGEVVVVGEQFGVRITRVIQPDQKNAAGEAS
jgi:flagellar motor switch protein FliN/FliY